jgi:large subunit ribosomal protein L15
MAFKINEIKPTPGPKKAKKRVGRGIGSGRGKQSTRGSKGQTRASGKVSPYFEGGQTPLYRRFPIKGFTNSRFEKKIQIVNLDDLEYFFDSGEEVNPQTLLERKVLKKLGDGIKILGRGEITKDLKVKAHQFSKKAEEKIKAAGGSVEVI